MSVRRAVVGALLLLAGSGCVEFGDEHLYGPEFESGADVQSIFDNACIGCHAGAVPQGGLSLTADVAEEELIGVPSEHEACDGAPRVTPGNPDASCLWILVDAGLMPPGLPLPQEQRDTIRTWIEELPAP